jgi:PilZ domain-containing protein
MTPTRGPYERRRHQRMQMATRDCRLTLISDREGTHEREVCTLVDLSYAGLRFHGHRLVGVGEMVEFLIDIRSPMQRSGFARARVRWIRPLGFQEYDAGAEFSEQSKGLLLGPEEALGADIETRNRA